ncbi:protein kinase, partial [Acinetobacter baumannii]
DHASDIYSMGILMYEALSGEAPFHGDSIFQTLYLQCTAEPPPLTDSVPEWLENVVFKSLEKDPEKRHRSARELADA